MCRPLTRSLTSAAAVASLPWFVLEAPAARSHIGPGAELRCPTRAAPGAPDPDLYCIPLAPTAAAPAAAGVARLRPAPSPYGTSVSVDGVQRWTVEVALAGLPEPAALGPFRVYRAWATTPALEPVVPLGLVHNGSSSLGPVAFNQFLILISAEESDRGSTRRGPLVLRGASASTRLQPHDFGRILAEMRSPGSRASAAGGGHDHGQGAAPPPSSGLGDPRAGAWPALPMHPAVAMPPGLADLLPDLTPFLPEAPSEGELPLARPAELVDLEDGDTLSLVAAPLLRRLGGRMQVVYGFNGSIPGPLIRVPRDATIGVGFENRTPWPATVHWHGVRVDNGSDGVPGVTQEPVPPGGRFTYRVRFPDAGIYWYHPHHRADLLQDLGLSGNLWVRPPQLGRPPVHREEVLLLDDLLVGESGLVPWGLERATHALMGRYGNVPLVNGEPRYDLTVERGAVVRFTFTNASSARPWNVSFSGASMKLVGTDLSAFEREERVESVVLGPAERYTVDVRFPRAGAYALVNRVQAIDPWRGRFFPDVDTLGVVEVTDRPAAPDLTTQFETLHSDTAVGAELEDLRGSFERPVDRELVLALDVGELPFPIEPLLALESVYAHPVEWSGTMPEMNAAATVGDLRWILRDPADGAENEAIAWSFREGDVVKVRLTSDRTALHPMHHPIHVHGQRFLVLSQGGVRRTNLAWKDTLLLPAGSTAEILLELSNPGRWMLHCHTAEHLEAGMQMVFTVEKP